MKKLPRERISPEMGDYVLMMLCKMYYSEYELMKKYALTGMNWRSFDAIMKYTNEFYELDL